MGEMVDSPHLFGERVRAAFAEARDDIQDAGNCLAVGLETAGVFHMMRAVEHGMRALANGVGVKVDKLPLQYQEWHPVIAQIEKASEEIERWGKGVELTHAREYFHRLVADLYSFKDDVRNVTMHTRKTYNAQEALGVKNRVNEWFNILASKADDQMTSKLLDPALFRA